MDPCAYARTLFPAIALPFCTTVRGTSGLPLSSPKFLRLCPVSRAEAGLLEKCCRPESQGGFPHCAKAEPPLPSWGRWKNAEEFEARESYNDTCNSCGARKALRRAPRKCSSLIPGSSFMGPSYVLFLAFLIGVVGGLRTMTAPAVVAWATNRHWLNLYKSLHRIAHDGPRSRC